MPSEPALAPAAPILGVDIGGTKTAVLPGDESGRVLARRAFATPLHLLPEAQVDAMVAAARGLCAELGAPPIRAVGVSIGGPLDREAGVILGPPHLPG